MNYVNNGMIDVSIPIRGEFKSVPIPLNGHADLEPLMEERNQTRIDLRDLYRTPWRQKVAAAVTVFGSVVVGLVGFLGVNLDTNTRIGTMASGLAGMGGARVLLRRSDRNAEEVSLLEREVENLDRRIQQVGREVILDAREYPRNIQGHQGPVTLTDSERLAINIEVVKLNIQSLEASYKKGLQDQYRLEAQVPIAKKEIEVAKSTYGSLQKELQSLKAKNREDQKYVTEFRNQFEAHLDQLDQKEAEHIPLIQHVDMPVVEEDEIDQKH